MKMNQKIIKAMETNKATKIERFCLEQFKELLDTVYKEELNIIDFESLASIYKVDYILTIDKGNEKIFLDNMDTLWQELDKEYKILTGNNLVSAFRTLSEVTEIFKELNIKISFN